MLARPSREDQDQRCDVDGRFYRGETAADRAQGGSDPAATTPTSRAATPQLSARTMAWLAEHPRARTLAESVWDTLAEPQRADQHPGVIAALRFV